MFQTIYHLQMIAQIKLISLISILFPIAAIDLRLQKIPNKLLLIALIVRGLIFLVECILSLSNAMTIFKDSLIGAFVIAAFFLLILLIFKNSIGMGDIKLFAMMGLYQGFLGAATSVFFSLFIILWECLPPGQGLRELSMVTGQKNVRICGHYSIIMVFWKCRADALTSSRIPRSRQPSLPRYPA